MVKVTDSFGIESVKKGTTASVKVHLHFCKIQKLSHRGFLKSSISEFVRPRRVSEKGISEFVRKGSVSEIVSPVLF